MDLKTANTNLEAGRASYPDHQFEEWQVLINIQRDGSGKEIVREFIKKQLLRSDIRLTTEAAVVLNAASTGQPHGMLATRYYPKDTK